MRGVGPDGPEGGNTGDRDNILMGGSTAGALRMVGGQPSAVAVEVAMEHWLLSVLAAVFVVVVEMVDRFVDEITAGAAA